MLRPIVYEDLSRSRMYEIALGPNIFHALPRMLIVLLAIMTLDSCNG